MESKVFEVRRLSALALLWDNQIIAKKLYSKDLRNNVRIIHRSNP